MSVTTMIPIGPWLPDTPAFTTPQNSSEALNVVARAQSYGPFPSFVASSSNSLNRRAQGAISFRKSDGTSVAVVGDRSQLYLFSGGTFTVINRTSGGVYGVPDGGMWSFCQFGGNILAFNGYNVPQTYAFDTDSNFSALGGSPPTATYCAVVGDFVVAANLTSDPRYIAWSAINNSADWVTSQVTQADNQDEPDGGAILGITGYDFTGLIYQESAIRRMTYIGPPDIFQISLVSRDVGCAFPGSVAAYKDLAFFCDRSGFYQIQGYGSPAPIGEQQVNRWFWSNVNTAYLHRVTSAFDPTNNAYVVSFPDTTSSDGTPNHLLNYYWLLQRWTHCQPGNHDMIWTANYNPGWTIEAIAAAYATIELMPYPWDSANWLGTAQRTLGGFDTNHNLGLFNGPSLAATIDTAEANIVSGKKAFVRSVRPMLDNGGLSQGATCTVSMRVRDRLNDAYAATAGIAQDAYGLCKFRSKGRYHRARVSIPAAAAWQDFIGVDDIIARDAGVR